jgi:hypothetical protein
MCAAPSNFPARIRAGGGKRRALHDAEDESQVHPSPQQRLGFVQTFSPTVLNVNKAATAAGETSHPFSLEHCVAGRKNLARLGKKSILRHRVFRLTLGFQLLIS